MGVDREIFKQSISGLLPVYKPVGVVSKDISRQILRILKSLGENFGRISIGHVGTLDPLASGVLPVLLEDATKLQDYLLDFPKVYEFDIKFGIETNTLDLEGDIVCRDENPSVSELSLKNAMLSFVGPIEQIPPLYSAVKFNGKPLYKYVRRGEAETIDINRLSRRVVVHSLSLISLDNLVGRFEVKCSKGTYVRVLAKDLARKIGTYGSVIRLLRKSAAGISLTQCIDLNTINFKEIAAFIIPTNKIHLEFPCWVAAPEIRSKLYAGQKLAMDYEAFKKSLISYENAVNTFIHECQDVQLRSMDGYLFGIGCAKKDNLGNVIVHMKRGLL